MYICRYVPLLVQFESNIQQMINGSPLKFIFSDGSPYIAESLETDALYYIKINQTSLLLQNINTMVLPYVGFDFFFFFFGYKVFRLPFI